MSTALVGACTAAAAFTPEAIEARAFARLAVAVTFSGALHKLLVGVVGDRGSGPGVAFWAGTKRAVGAGPRIDHVGGSFGDSTQQSAGFTAFVADTCIFWGCTARTVPVAPVRAVRLGGDGNKGKGQ